MDFAKKSESPTRWIGSVSSREYERVARGLNHLSHLIKILRKCPKTLISDRKSEFSEISDPDRGLNHLRGLGIQLQASGIILGELAMEDRFGPMCGFHIWYHTSVTSPYRGLPRTF